MRPARVAAFVVVVGIATAAFTGIARAADRAMSDLPDDVVGAQVHAIYAVPSGGHDNALDTNGTVAQWLAEFNDWFASQTNGDRLRIDTIQGRPDVTFFPLSESEATLASQGASANDAILGELRAKGFFDPWKIYAVIEDGGNAGACGWGGGGRPLAVVYLQAVPAGVSCADGIQWSYATGHEVIHVLGAVDPCATHYSGDGHVTDDEHDLMSAYQSPGALVLDPGHDDYYGPPGDDHLPAACPSTANLANSPFLLSHPFYRLAITINGAGAVSGAGTDACTRASLDACAPVLEGNEQVTLSATANPGYHFAGWTGAGCGSAKDCDLTIDRDLAVTATFAANPSAHLSVKGKGAIVVSGAGTCSKTACTFSLAYAKKTPLRAVAAKHWHFVRWAGACAGAKSVCTVTATRSVTVGAVFARS